MNASKSEPYINELLSQIYDACECDLLSCCKVIDQLKNIVLMRVIEHKKELEERSAELMEEARQLAEIIPDDAV